VPQSNRWGLRPGTLLIFLSVLHPAPAMAQGDLYAPSGSHVIRWWEGAAVAGGLVGAMLLDHDVQQRTQEHRTDSKDDLAETVRHFAQPEVFGTITLGMLGGGLVGKDPGLTRAGGRLAATLALAGALSTGAKIVLGRPRPNESTDPDVYHFFSGRESMPSGHTTVAFALATALADDIHNTWASIGLYGLATSVAWSRVNDNKHWLSDVYAGAVIGITSAKLMDGHWRIFHLRPPSILVGPHNASVVWQLSF
jgi:membrane-associated phospholipid phosphatase